MPYMRISRVLSRRKGRVGHLSSPIVAYGIKRINRKTWQGYQPDLHPTKLRSLQRTGFTSRRRHRAAAVGFYPTRFTCTHTGSLVSVALSLGSLLVAVSNCPALMLPGLSSLQ